MLPLVLAALILLVILYHIRPPPRHPLPPGPKPLPLLGNIAHLPPRNTPDYLHWLKLKDYGPLTSLRILGTTLIVIHDAAMAVDLLDRMAGVASDRPQMVFAQDLCGMGRFLVLRNWDVAARRQRRFMNQQLGPRAVAAQYRRVQESEVLKLLVRILHEPENAMEHFKTQVCCSHSWGFKTRGTTNTTRMNSFSTSVILKITYGYTVESARPDPLIGLIGQAQDNFAHVLDSPWWLVQVLPSLARLPSSLPGMAFLKTAQRYKGFIDAVIDVPYQFATRQMDKTAAPPTYVSETLHQALQGAEFKSGYDLAYMESVVKESAASIYGAGAETTPCNLAIFVLAMLQYPQVQQRAQQEIDSVIGPHRLPTADDQSSLPYTNAIVKETLRWFPVIPSAAVHVTTSEIVYKGYSIPKGAYLLPMIWWFTHDPSVHRNPAHFDPERFLPPRHEPDPAKVVFGYGRRKCPGIHLSQASLFLSVACILATSKISKAVDSQGRELEAELKARPGLVCHPEPFPYAISPRSASHIDLIRKTAAEQPWHQSDAAEIEKDLAMRPA
ncbi:hypothetical protein CDD81_6420 [Ophiocordyceps australis]|uniref:Uncharacterized protein n=1 Tax=Ophiocordyceps australis TaxID=1399860 RepID=A0A2C5Y0H6_9HYPO|nr:hypothetical protein CDD81_6420 [Ophiocordyceps australis]